MQVREKKTSGDIAEVLERLGFDNFIIDYRNGVAHIFFSPVSETARDVQYCPYCRSNVFRVYFDDNRDWWRCMSCNAVFEIAPRSKATPCIGA